MSMKNESTPTIEIDHSRPAVIFGCTQEGRPISTQIDVGAEIGPATRMITAIFVNPFADVRLRDLVATLPSSTAPGK